MKARAPDLDGIRATRAIIDLDAIADNVNALRGQLPATSALMAVVKADAYGHGALWVARAALDAGCALLGVATVGEGIALRANGIDSRIVLFGSIASGEAPAACCYGLEVTIAGFELLDAIQDAVREPGVDSPVAVHLKIDTGLRRYGAPPEAALPLAKRINNDPRLRLMGVSTHFASADETEDLFTIEQLDVFHRALTAMQAAGIPIPARHVANSAAIIRGTGVELEVARAGIALYGIPPSSEMSLLPGMRAAMRIESRIARVIALAPGDSVGYNRTFRAERPMPGALIPIGYADGYRRSLSGRGWMGLAGSRAPVLGRVSMDQTVVAIPDGVPAAVGDVVHVLGDEQSGAPSAQDLAELSDTNAYEVVVGIRRRVPRIYLRNGELCAVEDGVARMGGLQTDEGLALSPPQRTPRPLS